MVPPFEDKSISIPTSAYGTLVQTINDYGAITPKQSSTLDNHYLIL